MREQRQQRQNHDQLRLGVAMLVCQLLGYGVQFEVEHAHTQHREITIKMIAENSGSLPSAAPTKGGREWGASG